MSELLKKQMEVMSLLSTKLEEKEFRAFIKLGILPLKISLAKICNFVAPKDFIRVIL